MAFAHLHLHSNYTFLQALASPKDLCKALKAMNAPGAALTDGSNVCGFVEWFDELEKADMKPVVGVELWTAECAESWNESTPLPGHQIVLLAQDLDGWHNLCRIVSAAHRNHNFIPRTNLETIRTNASGLICLTGARWGALWEADFAEKRIRGLVAVLGPSKVWVETCDTALEEDGPRNELGRQIAKNLSLPIVATNDVRYLKAEDAPILEAANRIGAGEPPGGAWVHTDQAYLKTEEEMLELFPKEELEESINILNSCSFSPVRGKPMLPRVEGHTENKSEWLVVQEIFPPPKGFPVPPQSPPEGDEATVDKWMRWYATVGLEKRLKEEPVSLEFGTEAEYRERLEYELGVIIGMEYATYHLIVAEFINYAKDNGVPVGPGRGSAAGAVVCWAMQITDCNPFQFGLLFERFLNPERRGLPDIDVDFAQGGRERVIAHVESKYGEDRVGQILTISKIKAKAAIKDAARICGVHFNDANSWSDKVPEKPGTKLEDALKIPSLANLKAMDPLFNRVASLALRLENLPRQFGVHAAGVIVASDSLERFCPLHYDATEGRSCVGLDMKSAERAGLVKFDFLGLKTLDVIEAARDLIRSHTGEEPQITDPKFDDPSIFSMIAEGKTMGLFQVESAGMIRLLRRLVPDRFDDIIAVLALFRPGPLKSGMVDDYVERKHERQEVAYIHPWLEDNLKPTHGIFVYQEQILHAARVLAGFSYGEADLLRRAMGKKKPEEMQKQKSFFLEGCIKNGIPESEASRIFGLIDHFSGYGFNKSHSAAYGLITYITGKLKAHYPAAYMAAAMSFETSDHDKLRAYVSEARRSGILVLGPDINKSNAACTLEDHPPSIRYGLQGLKGVGPAALKGILKERARGGPFTSVRDVADRTGASKNIMDALVWSGALDSLERTRFDAWWTLNKPPPATLGKKQGGSQIDLFSGKTVQQQLDEANEEAEEQQKPLPPTFAERMEREFESLGCVLSDHPLRSFMDVVLRVRSHALGGLSELRSGTPVILAGHIEEVFRAKPKKKDDIPYARLLLEDGEASCQVLLRGSFLEKADRDELIKPGSCVKIEGTTDMSTDELRIIGGLVEGLIPVRQRIARLLELDMNASIGPKLDNLLELLESAKDPGGVKLRIKFIGSKGEVRLAELPYAVSFDHEKVAALERITGNPRALHLPGQ